MTGAEWSKMRSKFFCPHGWMNVWDRPPLKGSERVKVPERDTRAAHLNQKPLDLTRMIIEASSEANDVVWEPFGGLFTACLAAEHLGARASVANQSVLFKLPSTNNSAETGGSSLDEPFAGVLDVNCRESATRLSLVSPLDSTAFQSPIGMPWNFVA